MSFKHVRVLPFIGERYKGETPWGLPIMILGESHYSKDPLHPDFTKGVVQAMLEEPWKPWMQFFARSPSENRRQRNAELRAVGSANVAWPKPEWRAACRLSPGSHRDGDFE